MSVQYTITYLVLSYECGTWGNAALGVNVVGLDGASATQDSVIPQMIRFKPMALVYFSLSCKEVTEA